MLTGGEPLQSGSGPTPGELNGPHGPAIVESQPEAQLFCGSLQASPGVKIDGTVLSSQPEIPDRRLQEGIPLRKARHDLPPGRLQGPLQVRQDVLPSHVIEDPDQEHEVEPETPFALKKVIVDEGDPSILLFGVPLCKRDHARGEVRCGDLRAPRGKVDGVDARAASHVKDRLPPDVSQDVRCGLETTNQTGLPE